MPFLLRDLEAQPSLWVWALPEITGENPVPASDAGNIRKMTEAWLNWERRQGPSMSEHLEAGFPGFCLGLRLHRLFDLRR